MQDRMNEEEAARQAEEDARLAEEEERRRQEEEARGDCEEGTMPSFNGECWTPEQFKEWCENTPGCTVSEK